MRDAKKTPSAVEKTCGTLGVPCDRVITKIKRSGERAFP